MNNHANVRIFQKIKQVNIVDAHSITPIESVSMYCFYGYIGESTLIDKEGLTYITDFSVRNSQKLCLGTAF